jgi:periplasmic protein TonB
MGVDMNSIQLTPWNLDKYFAGILVVIVHFTILVAILNSLKQTTSIEMPSLIIKSMIISAQREETIPDHLASQSPQPSKPKHRTPSQTKNSLTKVAISEQVIQQEIKSEAVILNASISSPLETTPTVTELLVMPHTDAEQLNNPAPVYPVLSRRAREQGVVILEILVLADGSVGEIGITKSSGYTKLDRAAIEAVRQWRFVAARRGNQAIDFRYELPIEFSLKN